GACPYCGQQKDPATGACACTVTTSPDAVGPAFPAAPVSTGAPRLVVVQGPALGSSVTLGDASVVIGRAAEADLSLLQDNTVSRRHASVVPQDGGYLIRDEGSSNGTFVNGQRVTERLLQLGDEIQVGSTRIRFEA
ncbi:MAG TPA: FHA domain-containing protein, partial [Armatimonadota bacterium]|nr:FHA domain-containing protein [Armatimonadota bacterium]